MQCQALLLGPETSNLKVVVVTCMCVSGGLILLFADVSEPFTCGDHILSV